MKNLMEWKNGATGIVIDSNVFEYSWDQSQGGFGVLFTPRFEFPLPGNTQITTTSVHDVVFTNNTLRHMVSGLQVALIDTNYPAHGLTLAQAVAVETANFTITNNLFDDLDSTAWGNPVSADHGTMWAEGASVGYTKNSVLGHNTFNFGPGANINSDMCYYNLVDGLVAPGPASDVEMSYNLAGFSMTRDAAAGPPAVLIGSNFQKNTMAQSFQSQAVWNAAGLGSSVQNIVNATTNPDGRGANLTQLSALEAQVKAGTRPSGQ
jgi:hypothetical protein